MWNRICRRSQINSYCMKRKIIWMQMNLKHVINQQCNKRWRWKTIINVSLYLKLSSENMNLKSNNPRPKTKDALPFCISFFHILHIKIIRHFSFLFLKFNVEFNSRLNEKKLSKLSEKIWADLSKCADYFQNWSYPKTIQKCVQLDIRNWRMEKSTVA